MEGGDKVILHPFILAKLHERMNHGPLTFSLKGPSMKRKTHVGVLEFSSPDPTIACVGYVPWLWWCMCLSDAASTARFVPQWVMDNLKVTDGTQVQFRLVRLPKAKYVKLKPADYRLVESMADPRSALEHALRSYTAVTQGDNILVRHQGKDHLLKVVEVRPASACSVVGCDVEVDFEKPERGSPETTYSLLVPGRPRAGMSVASDRYSYFTFVSTEPRGVSFTVTASSGDPDVYVSCVHTKPSRARHEWQNTSASKHKEVRIDITDSRFPAADTSGRRVFYVAVHGYGCSATFDASVEVLHASSHDGSSTPPADSGGRVLGGVDVQVAASGAGAGVGAGAGSGDVGSGGGEAAVDAPVPPGYERCGVCGELAPSARMLMHAAFCERNNAKCKVCSEVRPRRQRCNSQACFTDAMRQVVLRRDIESGAHNHCDQCQAVVPQADIDAGVHWHCPECKELVPRSDRAKHHDLRHSSVTCDDCGQSIPADVLSTHVEFECLHRKVECKFCHMRVLAKEHTEHEVCAMCGGGDVG